MPRETYTASEAARLLGISLDTLRRWDRQGRIRVSRDSANRRLVAVREVERLRAAEGTGAGGARNRFHGIVQDVKVEGLLARVELVADGPARIVAVVTRESVEEMGLRLGMHATAVVKATSVMVER